MIHNTEQLRYQHKPYSSLSLCSDKASLAPSPSLHNPIICSNDLSLSVCAVVMTTSHHGLAPQALGQWEIFPTD